MRYNLPPFAALATFEAAARMRSFKDAAQELGVTPGAVSHQIKQLEQQLDVALFARKPRGVELTADGARLFVVLEGAFGDVARCLDGLRGTSDASSVVVGATTSVASLRLAPALGRFWREHPGIAVDQVASDTPFAAHERPDLVLRYGRDPDEGALQIPLLRDTLVPVCGTQLAAELSDAPLEALAGARLVHLDAGSQPWVSWQEWFTELGYGGPIAKGVVVTNYVVALQTASDSAGVALGWRHLVAPRVDAGTLVELAHLELPAPSRYYLVSRLDERLSGPARTLRDWLEQHLFADG